MSSMRFRPSALFPFVTSLIAFALVLILVLSGTNPNLIADGYLLSFNTTSVGQNLVEFSPATPATSVTPAANAARDVRSAGSLKTKALGVRLPSTGIILDSSAPDSANSIPIMSPATSDPSISTSPGRNITQSATSNSNTTTSAAPTLTIPQAAVAANPAAIPIGVVSSFFQLTLNAFATGVGDTLQGITTLLVTTGKQSFGVQQYYTMHVSGICSGSVFSTNATNATSALNITRCVSYSSGSSFIQNLTSNVSDSTLIAAANVTVPFISKVPGMGKSAKSLIDVASAIVLAVFIIGLIGNGLSIFLSATAFIAPQYGTKIHTAGAGITTFSTQMLQMAAITSTTIAVSVSRVINNFSDVSGLSASVGVKFLALIWAGYIAAQLANGYWVVTWFVKFRTVGYKARERTRLQMSQYKGIIAEVRSDFKVDKVKYDDTEMLVNSRSEIRHWND
ncbi:uncharacterized protein K444DRAFT_144369 [Hyaloscypha bicolor E]|uniref:Uncharacterized protein n=1 Tax=Hyaloscypha bicolor E TaxID=1095630 RepID=A0A2J6SSH7_9HELO|nr:uncharacterized protein K444DRAFT_144369 [Hyaloscypha bicolor E]PMD53700.1 hypothetical protein K444DRAFT_144369 [Hyaloscypha bicolor E]